MKRIFKKKDKSSKGGHSSTRSSRTSSAQDASVPQQHDSGLVADYDQVCAANPKVLAMLGVNDGPPTGAPPGAPVQEEEAPTRQRRENSRSSIRRPSPITKKLPLVPAGIGRLLAPNSSEVSNSSHSLKDSGHHSGSTSTIGHHRDVEHDRSLGLIEEDQDNSRSIVRRTHLDHTQLLFETDFEDMVMKERLKDWASSFRRTDPRYMIMKYFNDVAIGGAGDIEEEGSVTRAELLSPILAMFRRAAVFTVWRPTSTDAIKKMMLRRGTGKGLNIKGKSAKSGELSGYVPFVQINEEKHKSAIKLLPRDAKIRVFYRKREVRDEAAEYLRAISKEMSEAVEEAKRVLEGASSSECSNDEAERRVKWWDVADMSVAIIDDYAGNRGWGPFAKGFGVEISERLLWEAFVCRQNIEREAGSIYDTGRRSEPAYQDMNFGSTRVWKKGEPRTVVWQHADPKKGQSPLEPRTLLVAYEENRLVLPVVSDFDCFLVGTRAVQFENPIPDEQVEMLRWCINQIEGILDSPGTDPWSKRWLNVLKKHKPTGKGAHIPRFGYGDPKTYSIMECAVGRLGESGAVRHGAECFNYYFPQDLDEEYLVIFGDAEAGKVPWIYVNEEELRQLLCEKIDRGFTFPLNPKWVLCDPGWKEVYDRLMKSQASNVQESLDCWYPPQSGIREKIEEIYAKHQFSFETLDESDILPPAPSRRRRRRSERGTNSEIDMDLILQFHESANIDILDVELEELKMLHELAGEAADED